MNELFPVEIMGSEAMRDFGEMVGGRLRAGDVLALVGDLGAGKTHLAQGIVRGLGYDGEVTSPTFALVNEYVGSACSVYHFDIYRMESADELLEIGWEDYLESGGVVLIEWANKFPELVPEGAWCVGIDSVVREVEGDDGCKSMMEGRRLVCEVLRGG